MNRNARPEGNSFGPERLGNGLRASAYVPLADLDAAVGAQILDALARARIAAYLTMSTTPPGSIGPAAAGPTSADPTPATVPAGPTALRRLYVASDDRVDARTIVAAALRGTGIRAPELPAQRDPNDDVDTRASFEALVADWHVDTVAAVRDAERDLSREDAEWRSRLNRSQARDETWLDEDHYVPPVPPPLPRLAAPTVLAMTVLAVSIIVLGIGGQFGLASGLTLLLGIGGLLMGVGILFSRLREHRDDGDDDGAAL